MLDCCTKSGLRIRGFRCRGTGKPVPRRQASTIDSCSACRGTSRVPQGTSIVYLFLFRRRTLSQPGVHCTLHERQEDKLLQSRVELGIPKPSSGVDGTTRILGGDVDRRYTSYRWTNATVGGSLWGTFFSVALGVTRASEPPVPCGHRLSCCLPFSISIRKGWLATLHQKKSPNMCFYQ